MDDHGSLVDGELIGRSLILAFRRYVIAVHRNAKAQRRFRDAMAEYEDAKVERADADCELANARENLEIEAGRQGAADEGFYRLTALEASRGE